ncbi:MAG: hypothetical protein C3F07_02540 [Anaerolineales bacterium]|nr:MAG: hypothetical protein C3F07_02540 [Anaerolineales bacterium]
MRRDNIFWGGVLILLGALFLLQTQNIIPSIVPYLWPLALILVGGWIILGVFWRPSSAQGEQFSIALREAKSARFKFAHGAGQIEIKGGAPIGQALVGSSAVGMNEQTHLNGDRLDVRIEAGASFIPFVGPSEGVWRFQLTQEVPVTLRVETGASQLDMDLMDVQATHIELETGASNTNVVMPTRGASLLDLEAGAASVNIRIPEGTAARIRVKEGLTSLNVDTNRFPQLDSRLYQSANFDQSANRADINIEAGLGSITVK